MHLTILTPTKTLFDADIVHASFVTESGVIGVYPEHEDLVTILSPGVSEITTSKGSEYIALQDGLLTISEHNLIRIVALEAYHSDDITEQAAEEAEQKARVLQEQLKNSTDVDFARIQSQIQKELSKVELRRRKI